MDEPVRLYNHIIVPTLTPAEALLEFDQIAASIAGSMANVARNRHWSNADRAAQRAMYARRLAALDMARKALENN